MTAIHRLYARSASLDIQQTDEAVKCRKRDAVQQVDHNM
jgi:hypothetical protein